MLMHLFESSLLDSFNQSVSLLVHVLASNANPQFRQSNLVRVDVTHVISVFCKLIITLFRLYIVEFRDHLAETDPFKAANLKWQASNGLRRLKQYAAMSQDRYYWTLDATPAPLPPGSYAAPSISPPPPRPQLSSSATGGGGGPSLSLPSSEGTVLPGPKESE